MATACIAQSTLPVHGISKPIIARFDQPLASSRLCYRGLLVVVLRCSPSAEMGVLRVSKAGPVRGIHRRRGA